MRVYECSSCGAELTEKKKNCPLCGGANFEEFDRDDKKVDESEYSDKYEEVVRTLTDYNEGTEPESFKDAFAD
jgi:predicted amidophosphoribosyltransferase